MLRRLSQLLPTRRLSTRHTDEGNRASSSRVETRSSSDIHITQAREIEVQEAEIYSAAFLADGKHVLTGGREQLIRYWRLPEIVEVGTPLDVEDVVLDIAVSQDGRCVVSGGEQGTVSVWDVRSRERLVRLTGHDYEVTTVDVSPDGTKVISGSRDKTARVWSLATGENLLDLEHDYHVIAVKFSCDGRLFATATRGRKPLRIYQTGQGHLLANFEIITSNYSRSIAWAHKNNYLFVASQDYFIYLLDASAGAALSRWMILPFCSRPPRCIALASNDLYIMVSTESSFMLWDVTKHNEVAMEVLQTVESVAISPNHDMVTGGDGGIILLDLREILPSRFTDGPMRPKNDRFAESEQVQAHHEAQFSEPQSSRVKQIASRKIPIRESHSLTKSGDNADNLIQAREQRHQCETLYSQGRVNDAAQFLLEISSSMSDSLDENEIDWFSEFALKCITTLEKLGNAAMESHWYGEATEHFSAILSLESKLDSVNRIEILVKRSKARVFAGLWEDGLRDADEVIELDPSSYHGYERRHAALHAGKRYTEAVDAFHVMLARLEESPHAHIRELRHQFIDAALDIQKAIEKTVSDMPRVLIDIATGRLCDRVQQMAAFKSLLIYDELRSSMSTPCLLDHRRILREVKEFYKYVMLSHRWEKHGEPSYQIVQDVPVYDLQTSSPNNKLQMFCKVARSRGFHWAWSDTCCIDKKDIVVLHESLVAMFTWYRGSALTLVHLRDVQSQPQKPDALQGSEWNQRGWTYQEYVAAETVQFYTEDWKPYLGLDVFNHKESPVIVAEMAQASQVSAIELAALKPGLNRVREKLFLASQRQTTLPEDTAYSLLGIFNAAIPIRYGEGQSMAVGRLLEHILTGSGDVTILAWTGPAGDYNSCLPPDLTVYNQLVPLHIPRLTDSAEMTNIVTVLQSSLPESDLTSIAQFYHQLSELPLPSLTSSRLRLPGLAFQVTRVVELKSETNLRVYHGTVTILGEVEIKTTDDLAMASRLLLFHPWICTLLDQDFVDSDGGSLDDTTRALHLVARLRQRFGALLLTQVSRVQYQRVATDSVIMVQVREGTPLTDLMKSIATVDVQ